MTNTCISGYVGTLNLRHGWRRERGALDLLVSFIFYLLLFSDLGSVDISGRSVIYFPVFSAIFSCLGCGLLGIQGV
jgi:hypothetical protein